MAGEYVLRIVAAGRQAGTEQPRLEVRVDDTTRQIFDVTGEAVLGNYALRIRFSSGEHRFSASFTNSLTEPPAPPPLPQVAAHGRAAKATDRRDRRASSNWNASNWKGRSRSTPTTRPWRPSRLASGSSAALPQTTAHWHSPPRES